MCISRDVNDVASNDNDDIGKDFLVSFSLLLLLLLLLVEKAANFSFATNMAGVAKFSVYLLFTDSTTTSDKKSGKSVASPNLRNIRPNYPAFCLPFLWVSVWPNGKL